MDFLELNIHQRILTEIALNRDGATDGNSYSLATIGPKVQTINNKEERALKDNIVESEEMLEYMPTSRIHCNISFGELVLNFPDDQVSANIANILPVLLDILQDVPRIDFDRCLAWEEWALPDQLVFSIVSALLRVASSHPAQTSDVIDAIISFISNTTQKIVAGNSTYVLAQLLPAMHGLYRAISSTSFPWTIEHWNQISESLRELCKPALVDRLNHLLVNILQKHENDIDTAIYVQTFLSRYVARDRPLTGYFMVCCVLEMDWIVLAQALAPPESTSYSNIDEAAAANRAWVSLMRRAAIDLEISDETVRDNLRSTLNYALCCFTDLLVQIEEMDSEPSLDTYAWETMSESLKLASICSLALQELDDNLKNRLMLLLSDEPPICDNLVQEAALKATTVIVQSFPSYAAIMAPHLRRFIATPLPIFEFEFASGARAPPPLVAAAKCLALCIKLSPGNDQIMSNMYSLLNYIAATSKEIYETTASAQIMGNPLNSSPTQEHHTSEPGLRGLTEDEKRLVGISTISVVTRLALEFQSNEVTRLTVSMLLQRLHSAEPTVEAAIAYNLVDLGLSAPEPAFVDIIRVFSTINRSANPEDPRFSNNMVLAAQTRLAQELYRRPELFEIYLVELLTLFADKGVAIQNIAVTNPQIKTDDMVDQLASLLLPIDALLAHKDFKPQIDASSGIVTLFRNMWFMCTLFQFTSGDSPEHDAMGWKKPALARIASKTPSMILEESHEVVSSDLEYNAVVRQEYAHTVSSKLKAILNKHISLRSSDIRHLSSGQIVFLLTMHDLESMRSMAGLPSSLVLYFINRGLNGNPSLIACMDSIAEKTIRDCINDLNVQAAEQALPEILSSELRLLLVYSTHRVTKARDLSSKFLNRLITSFPSLMCDPPLVFAILEVLTLLRRSCENEFTDEYNPVYEYHSDKAGITLQLTDSYAVRNEILTQLHRSANAWFELGLGRAPVELQSTLQKYLVLNQPSSDSADLGATVAMNFAKAIGPVQRQLTSLSNLINRGADRAKILANEIASKGYFAGEAAGMRLATQLGPDRHEKLPPSCTLPVEVQALKTKMKKTLDEIKSKTSVLTIQDMKRLLFRCAAVLISMEKCERDLLHHLVVLPFEVSSPSAISTGIEVWTWVIAEKREIEVAIMTEILSAWGDTVKYQKGIFSAALDYRDPFFNPIGYSPTNKEAIDRAACNAGRLLTPHGLVLQMLLSRLQAARYRRPVVMFLIQRLVLRSARSYKSLSTNALAREIRFAFLMFGFETLKSSHLDSYCEKEMRESLYMLAYSWFAVRPQWSYGANRVQINADIKVLSEFLSYLQTDSVRASRSISSLTAARSSSRLSEAKARLKSLNFPLRLLVENELTRLGVWGNPINEPRRGMDPVGLTEKTVLEGNWPDIIRTLWQIDPAIAVYACERFKSSTARSEVSKLVRSTSLKVLDTYEALTFLIGERLDPSVRRDLKYVLLWEPVPPVTAISYFEKRFNNDPIILQYAHRVLEQHPVDLTFFFVPQVVQALRHDDLGYVARFVFKTAKISQHFCHQIIWNMKANCYKDDAAEIEDPMKPQLDKMTELVVNSLSGEAREFYDREFTFFGDVTSISGKLKPYIKKTKPEKKAKIDEEMAKIVVDVGVYLPSNPDGKVVDIDKKSGRPLQSHAKAPFMATFKVRKERIVINTNPELLLEGDAACVETLVEYDVWQQAIFKVGDDCRQDVLALQVIAMFKNIFTNVGLTLYLFPYRVTATAPGCGVIDVVPNATSRDEMGRAKVNDLLDFFVAKYGGQDTITFQRARLNFVQSMAAYSVACYILQIKDRHNGNIMIDGEGHIVHIDFGFLFDIDKSCLYSSVYSTFLLIVLPLHVQGVKFEPHSFKLNHEMVELMGGRYSQGYHLFHQLAVKAFLAIRPHAEQIISTVQLMLETSLPSFKGEPTIKRLRDRFALGLGERQAAEWMMSVVRNAHENVRSTVYDEFQRLQNGIPYK